jgi:hypothetical protein
MQRAKLCSNVFAPCEARVARVQHHQAEGWELNIRGGTVLGRIVREDCCPVEGAIVLWVVQPTLKTMGTVAAKSNAHNVG